MLYSSPELLKFIIIILGKLLGIGNILLLIGLLYVYWESYKEMKSKYSVGLLFFASFFLLQTVALTVTFFIRTFDASFGALPLFTIVSLEFIALSILLKITWER